MIQELLGGNNVGIIKGDQKPKLSNNNNPSCGGTNILDGSPTSSTSSAAAAAATAAENLRCPRCDSANTKFCYYNNYNLTQPRHFCKTCRRYWTKGGALRNVPIGGGCRKNKTTSIAAAVGKSAGRFKTASSEFVKTGLFSGFEHADHQALSGNPNILWASSQNNNYHFLSLLGGANQNPNYPNNNNNSNNPPNAVPVKEEGNNNFLFGSRVTGLDPLGPTHVPSSGLYRNHAPASQGFLHGEIQNNYLQELYQRLRSPSTGCYFPENAPLIHGNNVGSANPSTASAILESAPVGTGELGFWNANLSWPNDLSTTSGAFP